MLVNLDLDGLEKIKELTGIELEKAINDAVPESIKNELRKRYKVKSVNYSEHVHYWIVIEIVDSKTANVLKIETKKPSNRSN